MSGLHKEGSTADRPRTLPRSYADAFPGAKLFERRLSESALHVPRGGMGERLELELMRRMHAVLYVTTREALFAADDRLVQVAQLVKACGTLLFNVCVVC